MTAQDLVRRVAAHGLVERTIAERPLPDDRFEELLHACATERIVGLLAAAVEDGAIATTPSQHESLANQHGVRMARVLEIEAAALDAIERLATVGIPSRVLKGMATAHLDLPDPAWRTFVDADLLLPSDQFTQGVALLARTNRGRDLVERRPGFEARFAKDVTVFGPSVELDVHRTLALGAFGLSVDLGDLWAVSDRFVLAGTEVFALDPPRRLLHACIAGMLGDPIPRLATLRDAAALLHRPDLGVDDVVELAVRWRCGAVLAAGVRTVADTLGWPTTHPLLEWSRAYRPSLWERAMLRSYPAQGGSNAACILSGVAALPPRAAASYLRAWVLPDRRYRAARRSTHRPSELRAGARELVGLTRRSGRQRASDDTR